MRSVKYPFTLVGVISLYLKVDAISTSGKHPHILQTNVRSELVPPFRLLTSLLQLCWTLHEAFPRPANGAGVFAVLAEGTPGACIAFS